MKCEKNFEKFHNNILLGTTREGRIETAVTGLYKFVQADKGDAKDKGIADILMEKYLQGSYSTGTGNKPAHEDEEFDVDVVLYMNLIGDEFTKSKDVLAWLKRRLSKNPDYKGKLDEDCDRCVRVSYKGDFHLDVVPLKPSGKPDVYLIPDKAEGWDETNPKGLTKWFLDRDAKLEKKLYRIIKYLKWWRSAIAPEKADIASILFTILLTNHAALAQSDAEMVAQTMRGLNEWLSNFRSVPEVKNPSLLSENIARNWDQKGFEAFKKHFDVATKNVDAALSSTTYKESLELWRKVFGKEFEDIGGGGGGSGGDVYVPPSQPAKKGPREFA